MDLNYISYVADSVLVELGIIRIVYKFFFEWETPQLQ